MIHRRRHVLLFPLLAVFVLLHLVWKARWLVLALLVVWLVARAAMAESYEPGQWRVFGYTETMWPSGAITRTWNDQMEQPNRQRCFDTAREMTGRQTIPPDDRKKPGVTYGIFVCAHHDPEWRVEK